jgi:hypothetical protein
MQDLSGQVHTMTPTSQAAGNTVADHAGAAMTAPGSVSVSPVAYATDHLVDTAGDSPRADHAHLIGADGRPGTRGG